MTLLLLLLSPLMRFHVWAGCVVVCVQLWPPEAVPNIHRTIFEELVKETVDLVSPAAMTGIRAQQNCAIY